MIGKQGNQFNPPSQFLETVLDNIPVMIAVADAGRNILYVNRHFVSTLGYSLSEAQEDDAFDRLYPNREYREHVIDRIQKAEGKWGDFRTTTRSGKVIDTSWTNVRLADGSIIGIGLDISERKAYEVTLTKNENRLRAITDHAADCIFIKDRERRYTFANPAMQNLLGLTEPSILGKTPAELFGEHQAAMIKQLDDQTFRGERVDETRRLLVGGSEYWFNTLQTPLEYDDSGNVVSIMGVVRDITEKKQSQETIQRMQRLESIGILAGGIAHDFNNLLGGILGNIDLARATIKRPDEALDYLNRSLAAFNRARDLTQQLLTFSKGGTPQKQSLSLIDILNESISLALSGSKAQCIVDVPADIDPIYADPGQLNQVFNNIFINASQAMPSGGNITVSTRSRKIDSGNPLGLLEGDYVEVNVRDEGVGIPDSLLSKVFDPFVTTKDEGSGLGLTSCYSIVKKHQGTMTIQSELGKGTTVAVLLPVAGTDTAKTTFEDEDAERLSGRILIMDDEKTMRDVARGMLELIGLEVICTKDGQEAVRVFNEHLSSSTRFDFVLLDLTVPGGLGGEEAMAEILKLDPSVPGIAMTGYSDSEVVSNPAVYGFSGVLTKPFGKSELIRCLKAVAQNGG